jgi:hypothetical protein
MIMLLDLIYLSYRKKYFIKNALINTRKIAFMVRVKYYLSLRGVLQAYRQGIEEKTSRCLDSGSRTLPA